MSNDLSEAFESTDYRVFLDGDSHILHIGAPCPAPVAEWLSTHRFGCGWLITARNPGAEQIDATRNAARDVLLRDWCRRRTTAWLASVNEDPDREWPDEPGVLIVGVEEGVVRAIARRFGQAAIVYVPVTHPVRLVWIDAVNAGHV